MKVVTAELQHESNTFSIRKTGYGQFEAKALRFGEDAVSRRGSSNTALAGFLDVAREEGWDVRHVLSAVAEPSGPVTRDAFERLVQPVAAAVAEERGSLGGVLLGLHGAMVLEDDEDGEGAILARVRDVAGPDLPIAVTLDLHANVTRRMLQLANILVSYKTYPHVDFRDTGRHAAGLLQRAMTGEIAPRTIGVRVPMLDEANGGRTDVGPMIERIARARAYETERQVFAVSINSGFGNADIREVGPTVTVTCQGELERHYAFAEEIAADIWARRRDLIAEYLTVEEAARIARDYSGARPLVISDWSDNPGAGAYCDATALLAGLLEQGVGDACFGPLFDPEAAAALHGHSVGETATVRAGGKTDPRFGGGPLRLTGEIRHLSQGDYTGDGPMIGGLAFSFGPTAVLRVGGIDVLITSRATQMLDLQQFRAFGIEPEDRRVVALKSQQHFRAAFGPIAGEIILCDCGALCTLDLARLPYRNVPRPIFPLDRDAAPARTAARI